MRVFIGIKTGCEDYLTSLQNELRKAGKGNFTDVNNLHITLKFIGEVPPSRIKEISEAIFETGGEAFKLECLGIEVFNKSGIVSAKVGGELKKLDAMNSRLENLLEARGFEKEKRAYRPHITLVRKYYPSGGFDIGSIPYRRCAFTVKEIILFESRRENGRLVYAPLFTHKL